MLRGDPSWHTSSTGPTSMPSSSGRGRDHGPKPPGPKACLHPEPAVHGQAPVVGLDAVLPEVLAQLVSDPLGHSPGVDEHERRPVLLYVRCDPLEHRRHLLEGRHCTELVVGELDGDVERGVDGLRRRSCTGARRRAGSGRVRHLRATGRSSLWAAGLPRGLSGPVSQSSWPGGPVSPSSEQGERRACHGQARVSRRRSRSAPSRASPCRAKR